MKKGGKQMAKKGYEITNKGSQRVVAPHPQKSGKGNKVKVGKDLRTGK